MLYNSQNLSAVRWHYQFDKWMIKFYYKLLFCSILNALKMFQRFQKTGYLRKDLGLYIIRSIIKDIKFKVKGEWINTISCYAVSVSSFHSETHLIYFRGSSKLYPFLDLINWLHLSVFHVLLWSSCFMFENFGRWEERKSFSSLHYIR